MVVQIACSTFTGAIAIKFFDRRFATQLRQDEKLPPWTPHIRREYHRFVRDGGAAQFIAELNEDSESVCDDELWAIPQNEAWLHDHLSDLYKTEVKAYEALKDLQGNDVPQLVACVSVTTPGFSAAEAEFFGQYIAISGILLQYIEDFLLTDLPENAPRERWQGICDDAIRIIHLLGDRGTLNEDVKTRSFIVNKVLDGYKVVMLDFALCKFREEYEDEDTWSESKGVQDEERAVGHVMQRCLKGKFVYCFSDRWRLLTSYYE